MPPQKGIPFSRLEVLVGSVSHYEPVLSATTLAQRKEEKLALTTLKITIKGSFRGEILG